MRRPKSSVGRPTLAHGVMVLAGLATFVLVTAALRDRSATVEVLVAGEPIEAGTPVAAAELRSVTVDAASDLVTALVRSGDAEPSLVVARSLVPGEPVLRADLVPDGAGDGLRTVTLPVERLVVEGLGLRVGDRVDVVGVDPAGTSRFVAVDVGVRRLPQDSPVGLGRTVDSATSWLTVGVSDQQALDVAAASARGELVVIRSTGAVPPVAHGGAAGATDLGSSTPGGAGGSAPVDGAAPAGGIGG